MLTTLGARSFHAAAPALWNSLPAELRELKWRRTSGCQQVKPLTISFTKSCSPINFGKSGKISQVLNNKEVLEG